MNLLEMRPSWFLKIRHQSSVSRAGHPESHTFCISDIFPAAGIGTNKGRMVGQDHMEIAPTKKQKADRSIFTISHVRLRQRERHSLRGLRLPEGRGEMSRNYR